MKNPYTYRNLPCTAGSWYVAGRDRVNGGSGILEWCTTEEDANRVAAAMHRDYRFVNLSVGLYPPGPGGEA